MNLFLNWVFRSTTPLALWPGTSHGDRTSRTNPEKQTITELPKSLTSGVPIYYSKCENFKLFADLFQRNRRIHNQVIDENNRNYNQDLMRGDALQTFRKNQQPHPKKFGCNYGSVSQETREVPFRTYGKTQWLETHLQPGKPKLIDFLNEFQKLEEDAFRIVTQVIKNKSWPPKCFQTWRKQCSRSTLNKEHLNNSPYPLKSSYRQVVWKPLMTCKREEGASMSLSRHQENTIKLATNIKNPDTSNINVVLKSEKKSILKAAKVTLTKQKQQKQKVTGYWKLTICKTTPFGSMQQTNWFYL